MESEQSQKHHWLPVMILNNHCDQEGKIWVNDGSKVYHTNPRNVFAERNLNAKWVWEAYGDESDEDSEKTSSRRTQEYERRLTQIESTAAPALERLILQARESCPLVLSSDQALAIQRFIFAQACRTPESQQRIKQTQPPVDPFYEAAKTALDQEGFPSLDKESLYQDAGIRKFRDQIMQNVNAGFAAGVDEHIESEFQKFARETGLIVAVIRTPDKRFVIGSHGLTLISPDSEPPLPAISWLPVAPDVCIGISAVEGRVGHWDLVTDGQGDQVIDLINAATVSNSITIAGSREELVRSLKPIRSVWEDG